VPIANENNSQNPNKKVANRLLETATLLFAEQGYDSVSARALTEAAGVNLSAITYYFGGKARLYGAVIDKLISDTEPLRTVLIGELKNGIQTAAGDREKLGRVVRTFVYRLIVMQLSDQFPRSRFQLMLREVMHPTFAFDRVLNGHITPMQDAVCELVVAAHGGDVDEDQSKIISHAILGQCWIFGIGRPVILARLGWREVDEERVELIVDTLTRTVLSALGLRYDFYSIQNLD
tara:strand:+ start:319 stop:1020 length:702 start_codon:yes stop_codon:yes gene_type:complete